MATAHDIQDGHHAVKVKGKGEKSKKKDKLDNLKQDVSTDIHQISFDELYVRLGTNPVTGLDEDEASARLQRDGPNKLTPPKKKSEILKFVHNVFGGFGMLLWVGGLLALIAFFITFRDFEFKWDPAPKENFFLGIVLIAVVVVTGTFSYYQEFQSAKIMESFKNMIPQKGFVIRGGQRRDVNAEELVVGDVVEVKGGDKLPADIRLLSSSSFKVDNSSLTGESEPQSRLPDCTSANPLETKNLAFFSTSAVEGNCRGLVVFVGDSTVMGRIASLTSGLKSQKTPLRIELEHFIQIITCFATAKATAFFIIAIVLGYKWLDAVLFFIAIIVANVPEGLLAQITLGMRNRLLFSTAFYGSSLFEKAHILRLSSRKIRKLYMQMDNI